MASATDSFDIVHLDTQLLESLKQEGQYVYVDPVDDRSLWTVLQDWLWGWLEDHGIQLADWVEHLLTAVGIGLLVYVGYLLLRKRTQSKSRKARAIQKPELQTYQKEWDQSFLTENLEQAKQQENWALAIHWSYHLALVVLHQAGAIQRSNYKISSDYLKEIQDPSLKALFGQIRLTHQHAWYDERACTRQDFDQANAVWERIKQEVSDGR